MGRGVWPYPPSLLLRRLPPPPLGGGGRSEGDNLIPSIISNALFTRSFFASSESPSKPLKIKTISSKALRPEASMVCLILSFPQFFERESRIKAASLQRDSTRCSMPLTVRRWAKLSFEAKVRGLRRESNI